MSSTAYSVSRHYYKPTLRTEQSLDVYEPIHNVDDNDHENKRKDQKHNKPTIVLVMGSGWLGHARWIYALTTWWNASGPATIAQLGYRCISVRHSGGFFQIPNLSTTLRKHRSMIISIYLGLLASSIFSHAMLRSVAPDKDPQEAAGSGIPVMMWLAQFGLLSILLLMLWRWLEQEAVGAAQLDDMLQDVADALKYIQSEHIVTKKEKIVLGGYSSGGHVVATLLSMASFSSSSSSPSHPILCEDCRSMIQGVLYLSAVLSLDSILMNFVTLSVFGKWARHVPSPYTARKENSNTTDAAMLPLPSCWPIDRFPHLVVGCRHETFGIPILDATFCPEAYTHRLLEANFPAQCVLVNSNHWSVLNSRALSRALDKYLPWLLREGDDTKIISSSEPEERQKHQYSTLVESTASTYSSDISEDDSNNSRGR